MKSPFEGKQSGRERSLSNSERFPPVSEAIEQQSNLMTEEEAVIKNTTKYGLEGSIVTIQLFNQ